MWVRFLHAGPTFMKTFSVNILLDRKFIIPNTVTPNWDINLLKHVLLIRNSNLDKDIHLIFHLVKENYEWETIDNYFIPIINKMMSQCKIKKFNYVFNRAGSNYLYKNSNNILFVEYFAMQTYRLLIDEIHPYNDKWNPTTNKGLFLVGKPNKINRLPILYFLYSNEILNKFEWSLYLNDDIIDSIKKTNILNLDENSLLTFLEKCNKFPDNAPINLTKTINGDVQHDYSGYPFDENLYRNTSFSLITETQFNDTGSIYVTEKTWRAIVNKHPFIMAGSVNILAYLKSIGFRTFEKYLPIENYDSIENDNDRLNAICENLLVGFSDNIEQINEDVEYNFNHFVKFAQNEFFRLETIYPGSNSEELARHLIDVGRYKN